MSNTIGGISLNTASSDNIPVRTATGTTTNYTSNSSENFSNVLTQTFRNAQSIARNVPLGKISVVHGNSNVKNDQIINEDIIIENNFVNIEQENLIQEDFLVEIKAKDSQIRDKIANAVRSASKKYDVDPNLILAVIQTESNFNPNAKSRAGAIGLMQIMPSNFKHLGVSNGYDIEDNINAGTKLLKEYMNKYNGSIEMALMAYNGGPTRMANRGVNSIDDIYKMPKETQNYVPKVMKIYRGN